MTSPLLSSPVPPECKEGLSSFRAARERWQKSPRKKLTPISAARKLSDVGEHPGELSSKTQDIDNAAAPYPISLSLSAPIQQQLTETTESNKKDRRLTEIITTESTTDLQFETSRPSDKTPAEPADEVSVPSRLMRAEQIETTTSDIERDTKTQVDSSASAHRDRLVAFYKQHNPSKLGSVDSTLAKYKGREEELFRKLEEKYVQGFPPPLLGEGGTTCFLEFDYEGGSKGGRVEIKLFENRTPLACENFRALCTGEKGMARAGKPLVYRNSPIHRIVPGFCIQGGDFTRGDGTGGESIYPPNSEHGDMWGKFRDEYFMSHNQKGLLSLANNGPNRNGSQFFITLKPVPYLDGKHVVFGVVTKGMHVVEEIAEIPTDKKQRPTISVVIADCGEVRGGTETNASHESGGESTTPMPAAPHGGTFGTFSVGGFITPLSFSLSRPGSSSSDPDESLRKLKTPGTVPLVEASIGANSEGSEQSTSPFGSTFVLGQLSSAITSNEPISSAKLCAVDYDYSSDSATESSNDSEDDGDTEDDDDRPAPVLSTTRNDVVSSEPLFKQFQGVNFVQAPGDEMIGLDALATAVRSADVGSASAMRDVRGRNYSSESESEDDSKYDEINSTDELDDLIYDDYDDGVQVTSPDVSDDRRVRSTKTKVSTAGADEPRSNPFAGVNFAEALIQRQAPEVSTFSFSLGTSSPSKATNSSGSYK